MGKNKSEFQNKTAKKFSDINKVDLMSEDEVYETLSSDMSIILEQLTKNRQHQGKFPSYLTNVFANISSVKYVYEYVQNNRREMSEDDIKSMKTMVANIFTDSVTGKYQNQAYEANDRTNFLLKTFNMLDKKLVKLAKKLKIEKDKARELAIQCYQDPKYAIRRVANIFNASNISEKKKIKLIYKLYGKRAVTAMGSALTIDASNSDFVMMVFDHLMNKKKRKRAKFIRAYAECFKKVKKSSFLLRGDFYDENKDIIKELIKIDHGYKKAFDLLHKKSKKDSDHRDKKTKDALSVDKKLRREFDKI